MPEVLDEGYVRRYITECREEAKQSKIDRMLLNRDNFEMYQMKIDFSHKKKGQSKEIIAKTRNSVEQIKSFFQQSLADLSDWWRISPRSGSGDGMIITPSEIQKLMNYMLDRADYFSHVGNGVQSGLLGSLTVNKVRGTLVPKPKFKTRKEGKGKSYRKHVVLVEDKAWELRFDNVRQENYYPDPTGNKTYEIEDCFVPLHIVKQLAEGDDAIYDKEAVNKLKAYGTSEQEFEKSRETGQNSTQSPVIPQVKITEFYGTIVDQNTGDILAENVLVTMANDCEIIRKPTENPMWHQRSNIIAAALIQVTNSVWGIALMDAGTKHNHSLIELFNLMLDSAMKAVWGVNQIRIDALEDAKQITDGIPWGTNLKVNSNLVAGQKVMEEVVTGKIPSEVMTMFNLLTQETLTSMMTNDLRMGAQSFRAVKATEVAAAENSITSVFQGMAKNYEEKMIQPELELAWMTIAQNWDLIDKEVFSSLFGKERGEVLAAMEPQDVFVETVNGYKFEVFGISLTLRRQADFRKWTTLLQVIGGSEVLIEAFLAKYSFESFLGEIMTALDIDKSKIEQKAPSVPQPPQNPMVQPGAAPGAAPNMMSQTPSAANVNPNAGAAVPATSGLGAAFGFGG